MRFIAKFQERWIISRRPWLSPSMGQGGRPVQSPPHPTSREPMALAIKALSPRTTCLTSHVTAQTGSNSWKQVAWQRYSTLAAVQEDCSQGKMTGDRDWTPEDRRWRERQAGIGAQGMWFEADRCGVGGSGAKTQLSTRPLPTTHG